MNKVKINLSIEVPEGRYCNYCDYQIRNYSEYSKIQCSIFKTVLEHKDKLLKCDECFDSLLKK